ncbi:hypothetical protein evm_006969 [Chilo suppressalis]|nr:hypothetical protein evm_006969 [Chilo suppressalis]
MCIVLCEIAEVFGNQIPALNFTASRKMSLKEILGCPLYCHKRSRNGTANVLEIEFARAPRIAIEVEMHRSAYIRAIGAAQRQLSFNSDFGANPKAIKVQQKCSSEIVYRLV